MTENPRLEKHMAAIRELMEIAESDPEAISIAIEMLTPEQRAKLRWLIRRLHHIDQPPQPHRDREWHFGESPL